MQRASEIASVELARGRTPKETIMLEDIVEALRDAGHAVDDDVESLRRRIEQRRREAVVRRAQGDRCCSPRTR